MDFAEKPFRYATTRLFVVKQKDCEIRTSGATGLNRLRMMNLSRKETVVRASNASRWYYRHALPDPDIRQIVHEPLSFNDLWHFSAGLAWGTTRALTDLSYGCARAKKLHPA
jgi:hypothetical protein